MRTDTCKLRDQRANPHRARRCLDPGSLLDSPLAQQQYVSTNYTHVVRDLLDIGINVLAQLVGKEDESSGRLSLSCNPDLTLGLVPNTGRSGKTRP